MKKLIILLFAVSCGMPVISAQDPLNGYLETAAGNSPAVMAALHAYEAALQQIPQAGAYEDPRLDMGFFLQPMELVDGRQISQFQLMQMFPWFGTKKAARTEARHMAAMSFERFRETRDNLFLEVRRQWYVLNRLQQRLINNRENTALLKQLETLAVRKFSSGGAASGDAAPVDAVSVDAGGSAVPGGSASMSGMSIRAMPGKNDASMSGGSGRMTMTASSGGLVEVLRLQLEAAELESNAESILSEITAEKARFNALLNRPPGHEITVPDTFALTPYLLDIDAAMRLITEQNPMLGMYREESLAYEAKEAMSRKMGYPMLGIGLQYMLIGKTNAEAGMTGMGPAMNGKDMFMPMLSVSIPVFRGKYRAAQKEAQFRQQAAQAQHDDALNSLEAELYRLRHELDDAQRRISLYRRQAALARTTYDLLVQEFAAGKSDLGTIIQVQRQLSDYRLKESEAIADYHTIAATARKMISSNPDA
ncbi:MAG: TolC family protein, partial [Tannerella sp.]|nr:TolC family protein [Tannerella sp.]